MSAVDYKAPAGKLLLTADAPRAEWLAARTTGVGGTDIATLMGGNKYQTPFEAWQDKFVESPEEISTEAMWWGTNTEALTATRFEEITGLQTRRAGMYHHRNARHHLANPDRFTSDGGVLEIKDHESLSGAGKTVLKQEITDHAYDQLMWYLHVTGRSHGWFAAKVGKKTVVLGPFPRDEEYIARQVAAADAFWEHVETATPPPLNVATVTAAELSYRFPTAEPDTIVEVDDLPVPDMVLDDLQRLAELKAGAAEIDGEKAAIEARLKATVGDREYLTVHGRPVLRWQPVAGRKTFDKASAVKSLAAHVGKTPVEVEAEFTKQGAPSRRLSLIEDKAAA
jgi:putative phage-type endonuclease